MPKEVFHIITERCVKQLIKDVQGKGKESKVDGGDWNYPKECFEEAFESYCPPYSDFLGRNYEYFLENSIS